METPRPRAKVAAESQDAFYSGRGGARRLIFGAMRDKAVSEVAGILFPLADEVIATAPDQARAVRPELIAELGSHPRLRVAPRLADALALLKECSPEALVFITGDVMGVDIKTFLIQNKLPYLAKPFDIDLLKEKIGAMIEPQTENNKVES